MKDFGLGEIGQIAVNARDLERATAFYRDKLGMQHLFTVPKMSFFQAGSVRLMLALPEKPEFDHPSSIIYFRVANIQEAHKTMAARGVEFIMGPMLVAPMATHDLWMAFFKDTEGNSLALMSEVGRA